MNASVDLDYNPGSSKYVYAFPFEKEFDIESNAQWMFRNYHISLYIAAAYIAVVFAGQSVMRTRKPYDLRPLLIAWNLGLAIFSFMGSIRIVPELFQVLEKYGFRHSMCSNSIYYDDPVTAAWVFYFVLSKVPELLDTMFIVLRKQKLVFLHWFHHSTVLVWGWFLVNDEVSMGRWFISMNFPVHAIMYTYFALRALKVRVPRPIAMVITTCQILQMLVGFYISLRGFHIWMTAKPYDCHISGRIAIVSVSLYTFYFALFANFFYCTYVKPRFGRAKSNKVQ